MADFRTSTSRQRDGSGSAPAKGEGPAETRETRSLLGAVPGARFEAHRLPARIGGITDRSQAVRPGDLFVAIAGSVRDGHDFLDDAAARGAVAAVVEREPARDAGLPLIRVRDGRSALARLAAAWHDFPGDRIPLVGITGTIGKTSVLAMLESMLAESEIHAGSIGSLGVRFGGSEQGTGYTAPDALLLQAALRRIVNAGCTTAIMEVTSHALVQQRVHGLHYALGIFTNLVPFEHADFHGSFRAYAAVKATFLDLLAPGAPLVYNADDRAVRGTVRKRADVHPIACGQSQRAVARVEPQSFDASGMRLSLNIRRKLPRLDGGWVEPQRIPLQLRLLGRGNASNAALAATAALCAGAAADAVARAAAEFDAPRRRMQIVRTQPFLLLDDTVGHPDSVSAVMEVASGLEFRRLHIVFGIRGSRGRRINRLLAGALVVWHQRVPAATLVITSSEEMADERNQVSDAERRAFLEPLEAAGLDHVHHGALGDAVHTAMQQVREGDLLLLLGAQGMDRASELAEAWVEARSAG
jgi:UDP-N-acetylmuramoyl-L-alanyl-D-glutamate--2,6-diaminopimelate ligase